MSDVMVRDAADGRGLGELGPDVVTESTSVPRNIRRVEMSDLVLIWPWLSARLRERYPAATERGIRSYLTQCMHDSEAQFICTDQSAALATIVQVPMEGPRVQIQFVLAERGREDADPAEPLCDEIAKWAKLLRVQRVEYGRFDDVDAIEMRRRIGRGHSETVRVAFVDPPGVG